MYDYVTLKIMLRQIEQLFGLYVLGHYHNVKLIYILTRPALFLAG